MDSKAQRGQSDAADQVYSVRPDQGTGSSVTSVLLAEGQSLVRDMLVQYLAEHWPGCDVRAVIDADTLATALTRLPAPDLVLLGDIAGTDALVPTVAEVRQAVPAGAIAIYAPVGERRMAARLVAAGAGGILPKRLSRHAFLTALDLVVLGEVFVPWDLQEPRPDGRVALDLTAREREVLALLGEGKPNKEIAAALGISEVTVKLHVRGLFHKLGASNRTQAVCQAIRFGLLR